MQTAIRIEHIEKWYGDFHVLKNVSLTVNQGEKIVVCGPSGSGKSTLIRCINQLESHQGGHIFVDDQEVIPGHVHSALKLGQIGMVFQQFNLFPHMTVLENCTLAPVWVQKRSLKEAEARARELLARVRIPDQADKYPSQLSGGQQQRVAIARALAVDPLIILADEPTGNLDSRSGAEILDLFDELHEQGKTLIMVTHSDELAERSARWVRLRDGLVESDERRV